MEKSNNAVIISGPSTDLIVSDPDLNVESKNEQCTSEKKREAEEQQVENDRENKKSKKSFVWPHFLLNTVTNKATCKYCKKEMTFNGRKGGTSHMGNHLQKACHKSPLRVPVPIKGGQKTLEASIKVESEDDGVASTMKQHTFNQERCRRKLATMCIRDNIPFKVVEGEGFRGFVWELNPRFKLPSRITVARDCLSIYKEEVFNLKQLLKNQRICLTTDCWTSIQNINYMCLTGHWIDDSFKLQKRILNFCQIPNHKGETIGKMVEKCLLRWDCEHILTLTVDNASSNDGAIKYLKQKLRGPDSILDNKFIHLRCCAHILNLVVRDGMEEQHNSISRVRNVVRYVRSSPSRWQKWLECVAREKVECSKKVCLDVETRWNSTYTMLETALRYKNAFSRMEIMDDRFVTSLTGLEDESLDDNSRRRGKNKMLGCITESDWENVRCFVEFLKVFYDVTMKISGSNYTTANLFFNELVKVNNKLNKMMADQDPFMSQMATTMRLKYDKYWGNINNMNFLLYVAIILDPRTKHHYVIYCFDKCYGEDSDIAKEMTTKVLETLKELFENYKGRMVVEDEKIESPTSVSKGGDDSDLEDGFMARFKKQHGNNASEIDVYLSDTIEKAGADFDILSWWKMNSSKFPVLSIVAKHVLAMPISTVASESAFSIGGRVLDPFRSSLSPKTVEALICTQDWLRTSPSSIDLLQAMENVEDLETIEKEEFGGVRDHKFFQEILIDA